MGLSKPVRRDHIHTREIRCRGFRREDGLWDIEATLEDTKSYSFANRDRGGISAGEPVHRMHVRLTLREDLEVRAAEAVTEAGPFPFVRRDRAGVREPGRLAYRPRLAQGCA